MTVGVLLGEEMGRVGHHGTCCEAPSSSRVDHKEVRLGLGLDSQAVRRGLGCER